jgi:hypothetical protein
VLVGPEQKRVGPSDYLGPGQGRVGRVGPEQAGSGPGGSGRSKPGRVGVARRVLLRNVTAISGEFEVV